MIAIWKNKLFFGNSGFNSKLTLGESNKKQSCILQNILGLNNKPRPRSIANKYKKDVFETINEFYKVR